jgi:hypothetical protein
MSLLRSKFGLLSIEARRKCALDRVYCAGQHLDCGKSRIYVYSKRLSHGWQVFMMLPTKTRPG